MTYPHTKPNRPGFDYVPLPQVGALLDGQTASASQPDIWDGGTASTDMTGLLKFDGGDSNEP